MPLTVSKPVKKEFHLAKTDERFGITDGATMITVRQAAQGDHELRNDLTAEFKREYDGTTIRVVQRISFDDIRRREVFLTLCACNIMAPGGKKPLFHFENGRLQDEVAFRSAWSQLDPYVADEIHEKVLEVNELWNDGTVVPLKPQVDEEGEVVGEPETGEPVLPST